MNVYPCSMLWLLSTAQLECRHFCPLPKAGKADSITMRALAPGELLDSPLAYPPAICRAEYRRFANAEWCAKHAAVHSGVEA